MASHRIYTTVVLPLIANHVYISLAKSSSLDSTVDLHMMAIQKKKKKMLLLSRQNGILSNIHNYIF